MTKTELLKKLWHDPVCDARQGLGYVCNCNRFKDIEVIQSHIREVIGEDYKTENYKEGGELFAIAVNAVLAEQRLRAGLEEDTK